MNYKILNNKATRNFIKAVAPTIYEKIKLWLNKNINLFLSKIDKKVKYYYEDYVNYALDSEPDERDIKFSELAGAEKIELPKKVLLSDGKILNQGRTNHCVAYASTNGVNEGLNFLGFKGDKDPVILVNYIRKNLDSKIDDRGTYIVYGPKGAKALGWIEGYTQIDNLDGIKKSLFYGLAVETGTNKISWAKTRKNAVAVKGTGGGHAVSIVGYDDKITRADGYGNVYTGFLIVENTWGDYWGDNGRYYIPYKFALEVLYITKKNLIVNSEETRKYNKKIIENLKKEKEKKNIKDMVKKYDFFNDDYLALEDQENKDLFEVMQRVLKETGYKPKNRTILGSNADRTNARIYVTIMLAREYGEKK